MSLKEATSERVLLGAAVFLGYYGMVAMVVFATNDPDARQTIRDAMLVLGPIVGMIAQAVFRADKGEREKDATIADIARSASGTGSGNEKPPAE